MKKSLSIFPVLSHSRTIGLSASEIVNPKAHVIYQSPLASLPEWPHHIICSVVPSMPILNLEKQMATVCSDPGIP
jgi:hypothetical protein